MAIALVVFYFVLIIVVALVLEVRRRKSALGNTSDGYSTGKNSLGFFACLGLMIGNVVGGVYVTGTPAGIISTNLGYNWVFLGYAIGWGLAAFFLKYYRAAGAACGASTVGEVFEYYFSKRVNKVVSLMILLAFAGSLSSTLIGVSSILRSLLGIGYGLSYAVTIIVVLLIAILGGMAGLARLNIVHIIFLALAVIVLAAWAVNTTDGGFSAAWGAFSEAGHATMTGGIYSAPTILMIIIGQPFVCVVSAMTIAGTVAAKDLKTARRAQIALPIVAIIFIACINVVGICGFFWGIEGESTWFDVAATLGPVATAIACIAHLAAALSSDPALILMSGTIIVREFCLPLSKREWTEKEKIRLTRIVTIAFGFIFQIIGMFAGDIITVISNAYSVWAVCGLVMVISLFWKRVNEVAVFWTMLVGAIVVAIWAFGGTFFSASGYLLGIPTQGIALVVTIVMLVILTFATSKNAISENYQKRIEAYAMLDASKQKDK